MHAMSPPHQASYEKVWETPPQTHRPRSQGGEHEIADLPSGSADSAQQPRRTSSGRWRSKFPQVSPTALNSTSTEHLESIPSRMHVTAASPLHSAASHNPDTRELYGCSAPAAAANLLMTSSTQQADDVYLPLVRRGESGARADTVPPALLMSLGMDTLNDTETTSGVLGASPTGTSTKSHNNLDRTSSSTREPRNLFTKTSQNPVASQFNSRYPPPALLPQSLGTDTLPGAQEAPQQLTAAHVAATGEIDERDCGGANMSISKGALRCGVVLPGILTSLPNMSEEGDTQGSLGRGPNPPNPLACLGPPPRPGRSHSRGVVTSSCCDRTQKPRKVMHACGFTNMFCRFYCSYILCIIYRRSCKGSLPHYVLSGERAHLAYAWCGYRGCK